jgi:hypothetical protein
MVAVSTDPAPDSALAPSFLGRPPGQLPSTHCTLSSLLTSGAHCRYSPSDIVTNPTVQGDR